MLTEELKQKYEKFLVTEFTVFDIETSGLDPVRDEVLEIAGLKLRGPEIIGSFEQLIQPTRSIPPEVEKIHGLNEIFLLVNGRGAREVMAEFLKFIGETIVVGHNIKEFDWLFVLNHLNKQQLPLPQNKLIDTLELSRKLLSLPQYNLTSVAKHFGHEHKNAHRAMADVEVNAKVFVGLMEKMLRSN
jgi:DNA polymerase III epsilon subunit family exonuclease